MRQAYLSFSQLCGVLTRVKFRYLTKITDQLVCFLSPKQEKAIVWNDDSVTEVMEIDDEQSDRLFTFEVSKTNEQEEGVTVRPGFSVCHTDIADVHFLLFSI